MQALKNILNHFDKNTPKIYYTTPAILNSVCQTINAFSQCSQYFPRITRWAQGIKIVTVTEENTLQQQQQQQTLIPIFY